MGVADELAALRKKGSVKSLSKSVSGSGAALSTPDAEDAKLRAKKENDKLGKSKAKEILNKGSKGAAEASHAQAAEFTAKKKQDLEKKAQASEILSRGSSAGGYSQEIEHTLQQKGKKKAELEKKNEAKQYLNTRGQGVSPSNSFEKNNVSGDSKNADVIKKKEEEKSSPAIEKETTPEVEKKKDSDTKEVEQEKSEDNESIDDDDDDVPVLEELDDDVPELETPQNDNNIQQQVDENTGAEKRVENRNEKKARKMMTRLGLRPVPGIARATLKVGGQGYFFIDIPDVYMNVGVGGRSQDTYILFGEARQGGDPAAQQAATAKGEKVQPPGMSDVSDEQPPSIATKEEEEAPPPPEVDGVEAKDIELVVSQAGCSRAKAIKALQENGGDLVNAIMSLTT